jgi:hypothetical protein
MSQLLARAALIFLFAFALIACVDERREELPRLTEEIAALKLEIADLEDKVRTTPAGGLVGSLMRARLEVLKTSQALLARKRYAIEQGAVFDFVIPATRSDPQRAEALAQEISALEAEIQPESQSGNAGGLGGALAALRVQSQEMALAALKLELLKAKFGIAWMPKARIEEIISVDAPTGSDRPKKNTLNSPDTQRRARP